MIWGQRESLFLNGISLFLTRESEKERRLTRYSSQREEKDVNWMEIVSKNSFWLREGGDISMTYRARGNTKAEGDLWIIRLTPDWEERGLGCK